LIDAARTLADRTMLMLLYSTMRNAVHAIHIQRAKGGSTQPAVRRRRRGLHEPSPLFCRRPVPELYANAPYPLARAGYRQFGTEETGIWRLVRHAAHGGEPEVDRGRRVSPSLEVNPVPEDDGPVEREAGARNSTRRRTP